MPEGYFVLRSRTFGNLMFFRCFIVKGDLRAAVESAKKNFWVYPLASYGEPAGDELREYVREVVQQ